MSEVLEAAGGPPASGLRVRLSTDDVPEADRFAYWRETISEQMIGVSAEPPASGAHAHCASVDASIRSSIKLFRVQGDRCRVFRRQKEIARRGWSDSIWLYHEQGRGAWFETTRGEFATRTGDIIVTDPSNPFVTEAAERYDHHAWVLPRKLIDPHLPASARFAARHLVGGGLAGLVRAYLEGCAAEIDTLGEAETQVMADTLGRLLAAACGASAGDHRDPIRVARLNEVKRHIDRDLPNPKLTPETAARALKISTRQIHLLFEPSGTTFRQHVQTRRLEECRAALANPLVQRSVTDIAFAWGFNNLATFYRVFHETYGLAPGDMRAQARPH
jgi:AraC-like DNA-binding protein